MSCRVAEFAREPVFLRGTKSEEKENQVTGSVMDGNPNRCVIIPTGSTMAAESLERRNNNWIVRTDTASDLIVQLGDSNFHLHKLPMVSKSGFLNRQVFRGRTDVIQIDNFPGGPETFQLVVKFCYGWKIDNISAKDIAPLYCAARFLEMTDDLEPGNLVSKSEAFLSYLIFSSWKDVLRVLKSSELVSPWAKMFNIVKRCTEAIAWKAYMNPKTFSFGEFGAETEDLPENWWVEDVLGLRIDHFIEVIESVKRIGMRPEIISSCIAQWTSRWLSKIISGKENFVQKKLQRVTVETLIRLLPAQETSVSCNFLLHLLKLALMIGIKTELAEELENRVASLLEKSRVSDLLVKNYEENNSVHDAGIVARVLRCFLSCKARKTTTGILAVGRLVDGYLSQIARDKQLKVLEFQMLSEAMPENARSCHDGLYRAIDVYLKAHPELTEEERLSISKSMNYHKLSKEARQHAAKNYRLPVEITVRFLLVDQVTAMKSITAVGSDYRRMKNQTMVKVGDAESDGSGSWIKNLSSDYEIKMMKREVENIKVQLDNLQMCKVKIQSHEKKCFF